MSYITSLQRSARVVFHSNMIIQPFLSDVFDWKMWVEIVTFAYNSASEWQTQVCILWLARCREHFSFHQLFFQTFWLIKSFLLWHLHSDFISSWRYFFLILFFCCILVVWDMTEVKSCQHLVFFLLLFFSVWSSLYGWGKKTIKKKKIIPKVLSMCFNSNCNFPGKTNKQTKKSHRISRVYPDLRTSLPFLSERKTPFISNKLLLKSSCVIS